jgi:PBP4 family serine-type D-alanyl-D-alanine carboxypeptidase
MSPATPLRRPGATHSRTIALLALSVLAFASLPAQTTSQAGDPRANLAERVQKIMGRPEFKHSMFGIAFYSLDDERMVFAHNPDKIFIAASTTKLLTEGTALQLLGADFRFHTRLYRTGPIIADGTLQGDLVLVASGDPNLSNRVRPGDQLAFENVDHSYDASPDTRAVAGDPLIVLRQLAAKVAAKGIKRITGRVLIDATLFPEGERELGTGVVISPIVVNDNLVDVVITPGAQVGSPTTVQISPATSYVRFVNKSTTQAGDTRASIRWSSDVTEADGSHTVTISGVFPAGKAGILYSYAVPEPSRYAQVTFVEALRAQGVTMPLPAASVQREFRGSAAAYTNANVIAEHVSPPFTEEAKVTLKVSQNLHASSAPYFVKAILAKDDSAKTGFDLERELLKRAGLDVSGAQQTDGAGGDARYSPDFMVHYLAYMSKQPSFDAFFRALPVLGRDGTLWNIQPSSPAAGHVNAKTGTLGNYDALNRGLLITAKGLAGYMTTPSGKRYAIAAYVNNVPVSLDPDDVARIAGQAMGEIANAGYLTLP